jgi:hypothetical protein
MAATGTRRTATRVAQVWVSMKADDPEAISALAVARTRLAAGRELVALSRMRLIELRGSLPTRPRLERLLHGSIQFYNPHKERCLVRTTLRDASPASASQHVVVVTERGGERRLAAERWWLHETGSNIEVREGVAWLLEFAAGALAPLDDLITVRDRRHGLLCNPHSQDARTASGRLPLPWISPPLTQDDGTRSAGPHRNEPEIEGMA